MHGRPREYKKKLEDPAFQEAYKKKIYTIWNFRREALGPVLGEASSSSSPSSSTPATQDKLADHHSHLLAAKAASDVELALTLACLTENPKSYSTWHHRKWVVSKGHCDLEAELKLVTRALDQDSRNFHAWSYRKLIVGLTKRGDAADRELAYSEDKIAQDFSNYSAFHYRTTLLPREAPSLSGKSEGEGLISPSVLDEELDMVHQAFATDCGDQSPWIYYRWLLRQCVARLEAVRGSEDEGDATLRLGSVFEREM